MPADRETDPLMSLTTAPQAPAQTAQPQPQPQPPVPPAAAGRHISLHTVAVLVLFVLVLLIITAGAMYLCWQHPTMTGPITAGATVATVLVALGAFFVSALKRRG
jgi:hypothetical protein